jgi:hypothetical protein
VNKVFLSPAFPRRRNPFALPVFDQIVGSIARYAKNQFTRRAVERKARELIDSPEPFFLALMQRAGDSQLWQHSNYTNETFAGETIGRATPGWCSSCIRWTPAWSTTSAWWSGLPPSKASATASCSWTAAT